MKNNRKTIAPCYLITFLITVAFICGNAYAGSAPAGQAIFVHDMVWRIPADEAKLPLHKGDSVYETDTIMTGRKGSAQLVMSDGAYIAIRPNTSIRLDVYHYDKKEEKGMGESVISLIKGCFRSITGMIGKENNENYTIKTPVASIGIRGTDHEPLYIPDSEEKELYMGEPGLYDKVNSGAIYIENEAGVVSILPNEVGYVPDQTTMTVVSDTIPDVYEQFSPSASEESEDLDLAVSDEPAVDDQAIDDSVSNEPVVDPPPIPEPEPRDFPPDPEPEPPVVEGTPKEQYRGVITWADFSGELSYSADETEIDVDDSGNVSGYHLRDVDSPDPGKVQSVALVNPTAPTREESGHYSETTIDYGTWQADSIERTTYGGVTDTFTVGNSLAHWINGSVSGSDHLSLVITGTQTYAFDGGTAPTNQDGIAGTLNTASLSVDFTRQALDVALGLSVNSHDWAASGTDIPIDRGVFSASAPLLTVECDNSNASTWGMLSGTLAGGGLSGALLGYTLGDTSISETINGTASFYAPGQDTTTAWREIGIAGTDFRLPMPPTMALHSPSASSSLSVDGSGYLTGFDAMIPKFNPMAPGDDRTPVHLDMGAATLADTGTDADTGVSWGRWSGTINATDRMTGTSAYPPVDPQDLHFISGPEMTTSVSLPITGTQAYTFAGGTQPTDNLGNIGTLNSASLTADFTNMTVATGINATVGTATFDAASAATPIDNGRYFTATSNDSLNLTCTGTGAGTTHTGVISGAFYGEQGESAGMAYSFNTTDGASINTTVSGTAAFK